MSNLKTFVKWSGNKSMHLKHLLPYIPKKFNRYIEPFVGSGALFLNLEPEKWIINDINKDIICLWKLVQEDPKYLIRTFKRFAKKFKPMSNEEKLKYCRKITSKIDKMKYGKKRATTFVLMKYSVFMGNLLQNNKFYFNGLELNIAKNNNYSFLNKKYYNNIINTSNFLNDSNGIIMNTDYKKVLKKSKTGDFVFLDPPYFESHDYRFNYNVEEEREDMKDVEFTIELLEELLKLNNKGVMWMMTQADTQLNREVFQQFNIRKFQVSRKINRKGQRVNELLITNY
jgi:DNA adenine methylase